MARRTSFILMAALICPALVLAQSRLDSLQELVHEVDKPERVEIFCELAELYWQRSFDTSLLMATHAFDAAREINDKPLTALSLNMIGNAYYLMGELASAMDHYFQALWLREELGDSTGIAKSYNNIAAAYIGLKDYPHGLDYLKRARDIFTLLDETAYMFSILNNIGAVYIEMEKYDTARVYLLDAYEKALETQDSSDISMALTNLGEVTMKMGLLEYSGEYLVKALEISKNQDDRALMTIILANLGNLYMKQAEYRRAFEHLMEGLKYADEVNSLLDKREIYRYLADYYEIMGDDARALEYYKRYNAARDSILTEEGMMKIKEMEVKTNAQSMQQEISLLKKENEISSLKRTRLRILILFLAAIAIMGILVFIIYFQKNRLKHETNRLLEEKNILLEKTNKKLKESERNLKELNSTKDKFFSIIGHDLRNPLNALLGFSELISGNSREYSSEEIHKYSRIINEAAKNIHMLIENLLEWSRSQSGNIDFNPKKEEIYPVVKEIVKVFSLQAEKKNIKISISVPKKIFAFFDRNLLSTILRNLISNAIKFTSGNGKINISCKSGSAESIIQVKDTGIGMTEDQISQLFDLKETITMQGTSDEKGTGLGLILCKEFVDMHNGRIWVESKPGKGSTFYFTLPDSVL
jgi:signal transduction histidine kinase